MQGPDKDGPHTIYMLHDGPVCYIGITGLHHEVREAQHYMNGLRHLLLNEPASPVASWYASELALDRKWRPTLTVLEYVAFCDIKREEWWIAKYEQRRMWMLNRRGTNMPRIKKERVPRTTFTVSDAERKRRSELAKALHKKGVFGGPQPGSGRPRKRPL